MIRIKQSGSYVRSEFSLSTGHIVALSYERHSDLDARLLSDKIREDLEDRIKKIRKDAYELGWKDAKAKKKGKAKNFTEWIDSDFVGY